jgi:hypothetical protein
MNAGIVTSFIVGGLLLLAMLQLNTQVIQHSTQTTMDINSKTHVETLRRLISNDFSQIGFGKGSKIKSFNPPHFINFSADIYGQGTAEIIWHFKENVKIKDTSNPDDRRLQRNGPIDASGGSKPTKFRVVDFSITGYKDIQGEIETTNKNEIKSLTVEVVYESAESVSYNNSESYFPRAVWRKHFVPPNIQLENSGN